MTYIPKNDAIEAVARYIRNEHVRRYGRTTLAYSEYVNIATDILSEAPEFVALDSNERSK